MIAQAARGKIIEETQGRKAQVLLFGREGGDQLRIELCANSARSWHDCNSWPRFKPGFEANRPMVRVEAGFAIPRDSEAVRRLLRRVVSQFEKNGWYALKAFYLDGESYWHLSSRLHPAQPLSSTGGALELRQGGQEHYPGKEALWSGYLNAFSLELLQIMLTLFGGILPLREVCDWEDTTSIFPCEKWKEQ